MAEETRPAPEWSRVAEASLEIARKYPEHPLAKRMLAAAASPSALRSAIFSAVVLDPEFATELKDLIGWP